MKFISGHENRIIPLFDVNPIGLIDEVKFRICTIDEAAIILLSKYVYPDRESQATNSGPYRLSTTIYIFVVYLRAIYLWRVASCVRSFWTFSLSFYQLRVAVGDFVWLFWRLVANLTSNDSCPHTFLHGKFTEDDYVFIRCINRTDSYSTFWIFDRKNYSCWSILSCVPNEYWCLVNVRWLFLLFCSIIAVVFVAGINLYGLWSDSQCSTRHTDLLMNALSDLLLDSTTTMMMARLSNFARHCA